MKIRHLKELYCIVDMLLSTIKKDDKLSMLLTYSGVIVREKDDSIERIHVNKAMAKITAEYTESGLTVNSTTTKTVGAWLNEGKQEGNVRTNSYLSFITSIDSMEINDIIINGERMIDEFTNTYGNISLQFLSMYVTTHSENTDIRYILTSGQKLMTFLYSDGVFSRLVKLNDSHSLYVNDQTYMDRVSVKQYLYSYAFCSGIPEITTQIELFRRQAESEDCTFTLVTGKNKETGGT